MTFRPYWGMTIACALLLALLCWLGTWQLQRLQWKLALIAQVDRQIHMRPIDLNQPGMLIEEPQTNYMHVTVKGRFDNDKEVYLFQSSVSGDPGYHVLTPLIAADGRAFLVDRGFVPKEMLAPAARQAGQQTGEVQVTGIWRWPEGKGGFTPPADAVHRIWYWHDLDAFQAVDHIHLAQPGVIEADATPNPGGWPLGGQTVVNFRNQHLSYAVTWFGLAACLLGVWLAYHVSRGRIGFK